MSICTSFYLDTQNTYTLPLVGGNGVPNAFNTLTRLYAKESLRINFFIDPANPIPSTVVLYINDETPAGETDPSKTLDFIVFIDKGTITEKGTSSELNGGFNEYGAFSYYYTINTADVTSITIYNPNTTKTAAVIGCIML